MVQLATLLGAQVCFSQHELTLQHLERTVLLGPVTLCLVGVSSAEAVLHAIVPTCEVSALLVIGPCERRSFR